MTDKTTITNERLNLFVVVGKHFLSNPKKFPKSDLWYAVDKLVKKGLKKLKKVEEEKQKKRREVAVKLDKGIYDLTADGNFKWTDENYEKHVAACAEIDEKEVVDFEPHIVNVYDDSEFSFDIRNAFEGIVIPEIDYDKEVEKLHVTK